MGTPKNNQKKMLYFKNTVIQIKNAFDALTYPQTGYTQERNSELEDMSMKTSPNKMH